MPGCRTRGRSQFLNLYNTGTVRYHFVWQRNVRKGFLRENEPIFWFGHPEVNHRLAPIYLTSLYTSVVNHRTNIFRQTTLQINEDFTLEMPSLDIKFFSNGDRIICPGNSDMVYSG